MNICEASNQSELQHQLFESNPVRNGILAFAILLVLFVATSLYSIIWYERYGCDLKRTLGNRLLSLVCWIWIEMFVTSFTFEVFMYLSGHYTTVICSFHIYLKNVYAIQGLLIMDGIIISRYVLIFILKSPGTFQDEFWCRFIFLLVKLSAHIAQIASETLPARHSINYLICVGATDDEDEKLPRRNRVLLIVAIGSGIIHCIILFKIWFIKFKTFKTESMVHTSSHADCFINQGILPSFDNSITSFTTSIFNFIAVTIYAAALRKINVMTIKDVSTYPNYWFVMIFYLCGLTLVCLVIIISYFITNKELRQVVIREARQSLGNAMNGE